MQSSGPPRSAPPASVKFEDSAGNSDMIARLKTKGNDAFASKDFASAVRHYR